MAVIFHQFIQCAERFRFR